MDRHTVRGVIDLGCGPGVATERLAPAFPSATVVAVDACAAMLAWATARHGESLRLDLDGDLQPLGACDLLWAAMAIHHAGAR